jgi:hypothetical protein
MFPVPSRLWLATLLLLLSFSSFAADVTPAKAVAEAESVYADLNDDYSLISSIDSGLFTSYEGKDRAAWHRAYQDNRKLFIEKLSRIPASGLSAGDARAVEVMRLHLKTLPEQFRGEMNLPGKCSDARGKDVTFDSLRGALYNCFTELGNNVEFENKHITRISAMGMLGELSEEERRKKLFYAFVPLWQAVNGKDEADSPYRRLIPLAVAAAAGHGSVIDSAARTIGATPAEVERWLEQILDTYRQADNAPPVEPWNYYYRGGEADRLLAAVTPRDVFSTVNQRYYRDLGADLKQLGVFYDLDARPGKAPLAYTDYVTHGREVDGKWRPTVVRVSAIYEMGDLGLLNELVHENGHAVHMMAIHVRPAFMDLGDTLFVEAFADVPSWSTFEPSWQRKYLGQAAPEATSLRSMFSGVMLDVAWALFECRMLRAPASDPNAVWTEITSRYLHIVPHPELSWWALRVQLVHVPGYMVNYGLGSVLTADIRQHTREAIGPFDTGNAQWFSWTSEHLLRFGEKIETSALLKQFLGRPVSPQALLDQIQRIRGGEEKAAPPKATASE